MNFFAIIVSIFCVFFVVSQAQAQLTLEDSVKSAYENNPELKAQGYSVEVAKSQKQKAYGGLLPNVSADINNGNQKTKVGGGETTIKGGANKKSLSLSQDLFNGGSTYFDIQRADSVVNREKSTKEAKEQEITLNVIQAYLNILRYEELLKIEEENVSAQEQMVEHTRKKLTARDATKSEFAKANADYASAISNKIATENNLLAAKVSFAKLTGIMVNEIGILRKVNDIIFYDKLEELTSNGLFEIALQNNPDIKAARYSAESARHQSSIAKSSLAPTVKFTASSSEEKNPLYYSNRTYTNNSAYLNLHVPIFSSGVEYANISEANNVMQRERNNFEAARNKVKQQIAEYLGKVKNSYAQYESLKEQEKANEIFVITTKEEERLGTKSIIDLLRAKQDLYSVRVNKINLFYDKILAAFTLKSLVGDLIYSNLSSSDVLSNFYEKKSEIKEEDLEVKNKNLPKEVKKNVAEELPQKESYQEQQKPLIVDNQRPAKIGGKKFKLRSPQ